MLQGMSEHAADIIYSELAAKHLPGLAERFRAETKLMNAPMILMNAVTHTPYFVRFLTTPAGHDLASIQTRRIAERSDAYARGQPQERIGIGEACQFAATLLVLQGHDSIPTETRTAAISRLEQWKWQHRRTFAEEAADRCLGSLRSPGNFESKMGFMVVGFKMMLQQPRGRAGDKAVAERWMMGEAKCRDALAAEPPSTAVLSANKPLGGPINLCALLQGFSDITWFD